jgi:lipopolysaccharide export system permease protein
MSFHLNTLNRYIIQHVIKATLLVFVVILGFYFFISCITEVGDLGKGNYNLWRMFEYILMKLPLNCYAIFPLISLLGALVGLGILASSNEVTVMRASGMSVLEITKSVLIAAFLLILLGVIMGEGIGPRLAISAEKFKARVMNSNGAVESNGGVWIRSKNHFIYFDDVIFKGSQLKDVTDYEVDDNQKLVSIALAKQAESRNHQWYLQDVTTYYINDNKVTATTSKEAIWPVHILTPNLYNFFNASPREMSLIELKKMVAYQYRSGVSAQSNDFIFWERIFFPISILIMILVALPFMFGSLRNTSLGLRLTIGTIIGLVFLLMNKILGSFSTAIFIPPEIAAFLPLLIFGVFAFYLMRRFS